MKKTISLLLVFAMLLAMVPLLTTTTAQAATKKETKRIIGIVFDNSGSMYNVDGGCDPKAWCQATYAMEVFASMMNSGDQLRIYPMHQIQVGAENYSMYSPLVIKGPGDASKIRDIYTISAGGTPGSTIDCAYNDLVAARGYDQKYLIVLTDGAMNEMADANGYVTDEGVQWLYDKLNECSKKVDQLMYLAIGVNAIPLTKKLSNQYYAHAEKSAEVLTHLTAMCNRIFGRHQLEGKNFDGKNLNFDVSMGKIIIFAQGANVTGVSVDGLGSPTSMVSTKYSEKGAGNKTHCQQIDSSLQGIIATYEGELDAGEYIVNFVGDPDAVCVYYEPDVDVQVKLMSPDGEIAPGSDLYEGNYSIDFCIVDRNGNPVDSELLGDVNFTVTVTKNGVEETHTITGKSGSVPVSLAGGDTFDADFVATYLDGYEIRKKGSDFGWPSFGFTIKYPEKAFVMQLTGAADTIGLTKLEDEAVFQLKMFYDGVQMTGDALDAVTDPQVSLTGGNAEYTIERKEDGYEIRLKYHGSARDTQVGPYTLTVSASCTNEDGELVEASPVTRNFTIEDNAGQFQAEMVMEQDYYVIADIAEGKPIYINLSCGGAPLTAEQFAATKVTVDLGGLPYELTPDEAGSRYIITLKEGEGLVKGKYTVSVKVEGVDEIGRSASFEDAQKLQVQPYSRTVRILSWIVIILLALILIIIIVLLIANSKVLPKDIRVAAQSTFTVDGDQIPGAVRYNYDKSGKRATFRVESPQCVANPQAKCGVVLSMEAYSPRKTRSAARHVRICGISPTNPRGTNYLQVGNFTMTKSDPGDPTSKLVRRTGKPDAPIDFHIGNNAKIVIKAEVADPNDGNSVECTLAVTLKFY